MAVSRNGDNLKYKKSRTIVEIYDATSATLLMPFSTHDACIYPRISFRGLQPRERSPKTATTLCRIAETGGKHKPSYLDRTTEWIDLSRPWIYPRESIRCTRNDDIKRFKAQRIVGDAEIVNYSVAF